MIANLNRNNCEIAQREMRIATPYNHNNHNDNNGNKQKHVNRKKNHCDTFFSKRQ